MRDNRIREIFRFHLFNQPPGFPDGIITVSFRLNVHGLYDAQCACVRSVVTKQVVFLDSFITTEQKAGFRVVRQPGIINLIQIEQVMVTVDDIKIHIQTGEVRKVCRLEKIIGH